MDSNLKQDQIPQKQAENWRKSFLEEQKLTFNLIVPQILLKKETYKALAGKNENRVRIYLGLEKVQQDGKYVLCAFAVSTVLVENGEDYVDSKTPVYKLSQENKNYSENTEVVVESIRMYRKWRNGELAEKEETAAFRKYIYPNAYLMTNSELNEIFETQDKNVAQIEFGISKSMHIMISPVIVEKRAIEDDSEVYDWGGFCPPYCDENSLYNS